jgi:hypothetical protein
MELKHLALLLSIFCIAFLYFLSLFSAPVAVKLSNISCYEGREVVVEGTVTRCWALERAQLIEIEEKNSKALLFLNSKLPLEYGDRIRAVGKVKKYGDTWEVVLKSERSIKILEKGNKNPIPLWQIAENPLKYVDKRINVTGIVDKVYNSFFILVDPEGRYSIPVYCEPNFSKGDAISIQANLVYDSQKLRFVLKQC